MERSNAACHALVVRVAVLIIVYPIRRCHKEQVEFAVPEIMWCCDAGHIWTLPPQEGRLRVHMAPAASAGQWLDVRRVNPGMSIGSGSEH